MSIPQAAVKVWDKSSVLTLLDTSDKAVVQAIKGLYARQTSTEQVQGVAVVHNGRGFNSRDAGFFTSVAKALPRYNDNMTLRQKAVSRKMLRKYWKQLLEMIEEKGGVVSYKTPKPVSETAIAPVNELTPDNWTV